MYLCELPSNVLQHDKWSTLWIRLADVARVGVARNFAATTAQFHFQVWVLDWINMGRGTKIVIVQVFNRKISYSSALLMQYAWNSRIKNPQTKQILVFWRCGGRTCTSALLPATPRTAGLRVAKSTATDQWTKRVREKNGECTDKKTGIRTNIQKQHR